MNTEQVESIKSRPEVPARVVFCVNRDLENKEDRTLLYGYTLDRNTFHVYLQNELLHLLVYTYNRDVVDYQEGQHLSASALIPSKRVYPECSDFEFCYRLVTQFNFYIPFTTFRPERERKQFYGLRVFEL